MTVVKSSGFLSPSETARAQRADVGDKDHGTATIETAKEWPSMHEYPADIRDISVKTQRLQLAIAAGDMLDEMSLVATRGIHPSGEVHFVSDWSNGSTSEVRARVHHYVDRAKSRFSQTSWTIVFAVIQAGSVIGSASIFAKNYADNREFGTKSWLGVEHQGLGLGKEIRSAMLGLGFEGLHGKAAYSHAFEDNIASSRVSMKLGYAARERVDRLVAGTVHKRVLWWLEHEEWRRNVSQHYPVEILGVDKAAKFLGV